MPWGIPETLEIPEIFEMPEIPGVLEIPGIPTNFAPIFTEIGKYRCEIRRVRGPAPPTPGACLLVAAKWPLGHQLESAYIAQW